MSTHALPWLKFYPTDWRGDSGLRGCGFAARGLWMDILSLMHEAEPYGHLLVNGKAPSAKRLAAMLGGSETEITKLLDELEDAGVFSRIDGGVIVSRRMIRDNLKAQDDRENGKAGGNPALKGNRPSPDNGGVNPTHKGDDKAQRPESRIQKEEAPPLPPKVESVEPPPPEPVPSLAAMPGRMPARNALLPQWVGVVRGDEWRIWDSGEDAGKSVPVIGGFHLLVAVRLVCEAAKIGNETWRGDWLTLVAWLRDGFDLHEQILPTIKRIAGRPNYQPPGALRYFDSAVRATGIRRAA
jgi:DNA-binding Lrp family transcriptional regulator